MNKSFALLTCLSLPICLSVLAAAARAEESRYITDILQLGLYATRDATGEPIRKLVSGTEVTVLERIPNFARVRTQDGEEGWVKSAFLVEEKPARLRVAELEAQLTELEQALDSAADQRDAVATDAGERAARAERELDEVRSNREAVSSLEQENDFLAEGLDSYRGSVPWPWVVGALVVALVAGFCAGYWWLDASIRRRHGGFRVY